MCCTNGNSRHANASLLRAKAAWARLIRKVYEADPLACPKCKAPMRFITLVEELEIIRRIRAVSGRTTLRLCNCRIFRLESNVFQP